MTQFCCCGAGRFIGEWGLTFFGLEEHNRTVDVAASFAPASPLVLLAKLLLTAWTVSTLVLQWYRADHILFFMAYWTNWTLIACCIYMMLSFCLSLTCCCRRAQEVRKEGTTAGFWVRLTWVSFAIAAVNALAITPMFWVLEFDPANRVSYFTVMTHGGIALLVLVEGLCINHIPVRLKHWLWVALYQLVYLSWTLAHGFLELGNPDKEDEGKDDDTIYAKLDWKDKLITAIIVSAGAIFVLTPVLLLVVWCLSLKFRRYLPLGEDKYDNGRPANNRNDLEEAGIPKNKRNSSKKKSVRSELRSQNTSESQDDLEMPSVRITHFS